MGEKKKVKINWKKIDNKTYECPTCGEKIGINKSTDFVEHFIFCSVCGRKLVFFE